MSKCRDQNTRRAKRPARNPKSPTGRPTMRAITEARPALPSAGQAYELTRSSNNDLASSLQQGFHLSGNPFTDERSRAELQGFGLAGSLYDMQIAAVAQACMGTEGAIGIMCTALDHAKQAVQSMDCRDPLERMLVEQMLLTHSRVMHLSRLACQGPAIPIEGRCSPFVSNRDPRKPSVAINQTNIHEPESIVRLNESCDIAQQQVVGVAVERKSTERTRIARGNPSMTPRRQYVLSRVGRRTLQRTARLKKPWRYSTGPKTSLGKAISSMNALKHGERSAITTAFQRACRAAMVLAATPGC
jgi:hypothetical protein